MANRSLLQRVLVLTTAGLGGLLYGIDLGIISSALPYMEATLGFTQGQLSLIVAAVLIGCVFATLIAGMMTDWLGRRPILIASGIAFILSVPLIATANSFTQLMTGRIFQGISAGFIGVVVPLYLAECMGAVHRGKGIGLFQWMLTLGILLAALIGMAFSLYVDGVAERGDAELLFATKDLAWRRIFWVSLVPGALFVVGSFFLGESPRWLFRRGRRDAAYAALLRTSDVEKADVAITAMETTKQQTPSVAAGTAKESLLQRRYMYPFILACVILACTQLTGANSIIGYNTTILLQSGLNDVQAHWGYVFFNTCGYLATIGALLLVDRKGRTFLLSLGTAGIVLTLCGVGILFHRMEAQRVDCSAQIQALVENDRLDALRFDQALSDTLLANKATGGQPTTLLIIHSYGGFTAATAVVRSDDAAALPLTVTRDKSLPKNSFSAFLSNPFADLETANQAPLIIKNAIITPVPTATNGWLTAIGLCAFKMFFAIGPGVCVWLALSELMPTRIRSNGMSIALLINNVVSASIAAVFLPSVGQYGYSTIFFIFAGFTTFYFIVARFVLPETKGRTLEEIEHVFAGNK